MQEVRGRSAKPSWLIELAQIPLDGANFDVFPFLGRQIRLQRTNQEQQFCARVEQRLAMIGKWERDKPSPCNPTINVAADQPIFQFGRWRGSRERDGLISVGVLQCLKPG